MGIRVVTVIIVPIAQMIRNVIRNNLIILTATTMIQTDRTQAEKIEHGLFIYVFLFGSDIIDGFFYPIFA